MKTREELISAVLSKLGVLSKGSAVSAEDSALVSGYLEPVAGELAVGHIYRNLSVTAVQDNIFLPLRDYVAFRCCNEFGIVASSPEYATLKSEALVAEGAMKAADRFVADILPTVEFDPLLSWGAAGRYGTVI